MTTTPSPHATSEPKAPRWPLSGMTPAEVGRATASVLLGFPVAVAAFTLGVTLFALGLGLLIVYPIALPVIAGWVAVVGGINGLERWRIHALLGFQVPGPPPLPTSGSWHRRLRQAALDRHTWRSFGYLLVRLPVAIVTFTFVVAAWATPLMLIAQPLALLVSATPPLGGDAALDLGSAATLGILLGMPALGLLLLPLIPVTVRAMSHLESSLVAALLGPSDRSRLDGRVRELASTRSDLVDIADQERRRIERDLHDGAGQQLVALAMTLGMAREKLAVDPDQARALIDEAHDDAKRALVGLREIVRGISPAILADRGLGAALSAVAARSGLPISLVVDVPERPDPAIEGIAYYIVCEGISNAIRHADATQLRVTVVRHDDVLEVEVVDDGSGHADPSRGTGLRGLAGRVAAVDGDFRVTSPAGGPTVIRADLPADVGHRSAEAGS